MAFDQNCVSSTLVFKGVKEVEESLQCETHRNLLSDGIILHDLVGSECEIILAFGRLYMKIHLEVSCVERPQTDFLQNAVHGFLTNKSAFKNYGNTTKRYKSLLGHLHWRAHVGQDIFVHISINLLKVEKRKSRR